MTKRFRDILFYLLTALFFILAVAAIFYSNGWRFDLETFSISTLGGIYFEKIPDGATLTVEKIDMRFNPGFLKSSVLIANLFPKTYTAKAVKEGYQSWTKQISVQPSLVTEIDPIIMLPEKPASSTPIAKNIRNFWVGIQHLITQTITGNLMFRTSRIAGSDVIAWSDDGESVITSDSGKYFLIDLNNPGSALNLRPAFLNARKASSITDVSPIIAPYFQPHSSSVLIITTENGLYLFDSDRFTAKTISQKPVTAFAAHDNEIIFSSGNSIFAYDSGAATSTELVLSDPFPRPVEIQYSETGEYLTLRNTAGKLELVNRRNLTSVTLAENAKKSLFDPTGGKIAFTTSNNEIVIYTFIRKSLNLDKPGTEVLRISGENEETISWHKNSAYLFLEYPDSLYLFEANSIPPINMQRVEENIRKYAYDPEKNLIYLLKNNTLISIELE